MSQGERVTVIVCMISDRWLRDYEVLVKIYMICLLVIANSIIMNRKTGTLHPIGELQFLFRSICKKAEEMFAQAARIAWIGILHLVLECFIVERHAHTLPNQEDFFDKDWCIDQVSVRYFVEFWHKFQCPTAAHFINFLASFSATDRESLGGMMLSYGLLINEISLEGFTVHIDELRPYEENSHPTILTSGFWHGYPLSFSLLRFTVKWTIHSATKGFQDFRIFIDRLVADCKFVYDLLILGKDMVDL